MDLGLKDKVAFIAGASRGIGYAIAESFLNEGAKVANTGRGADALADAAKRLSAIAGADKVFHFAGDMTATPDIAASLDAAAAALGPVDHVIANVGIGSAPTGFDVTDEDWAGDVLQNLTGSMFLAREGLKRMLARPAADRGQPSVIFISSIAGVDAIGTSLPYGASKAALNHVTREMAKQVGKDNIRINTIAPGNILFPGGNWEKIVEGNPGYFGKWIDREVALKRFGKVEEIADAVVFAASERASFLTGEVMVVDGGQVR
jgi:3-oxoacyl-[acyl-carrier protein] reductase